jgi:DNA-binding transcriptional LysR family regulator
MALDAVATEGTFARAASRLGYTQSAVSQQIAALERMVGASLFDRPGGPRPASLTPLGRFMLSRSRELIGRVEVIGGEVERFLAGDVGRIGVGTFQSVSTALLPAIIGRLRAEHPGVDIRVFQSDDQNETYRRLVSGELDVAFAIGDIGAGLDSAVLLDDPFVLIAPPGVVPSGCVPTVDLDGRPSSAPNHAPVRTTSTAGCAGSALNPTTCSATTRRWSRWCGPAWAWPSCRCWLWTSKTPRSPWDGSNHRCPSGGSCSAGSRTAAGHRSPFDWWR